jgi:hypothetical protein
MRVSRGGFSLGSARCWSAQDDINSAASAAHTNIHMHMHTQESSPQAQPAVNSRRQGRREKGLGSGRAQGAGEWIENQEGQVGVEGQGTRQETGEGVGYTAPRNNLWLM